MLDLQIDHENNNISSKCDICIEIDPRSKILVKISILSPHFQFRVAANLRRILMKYTSKEFAWSYVRRVGIQKF